jgi:hypothetical protein
MPTACQTVFRQRICHFPACHSVFYLCHHCDRGQRYCSPRCREKSRRQQRRQANRRHQQSLEGRLDHRDRQRAYRWRQQQGRVTDQGSFGPFPCARMAGPRPLLPMEIADLKPERDLGWVVCQICGRRGHFLNPFYSPR